MQVSRKKATEKRWIKYNKDGASIELLVRSFPVSLMKAESDMTNALKLWNYCVCDWKEFCDDEDQPMECNSDNKKFIFDYWQEIVVFVIEEVNESSQELAAISKNS